MKKIITYVLISLLSTIILFGCGKKQADGKIVDDKIKIVCTIFPQYDWAREVLGNLSGNFDLTLLINSRVDLHNYQPSVEDIAKISTSDLFIYVGGESDEWVEDVLASASNKNMVTINLLESLGGAVKKEEIVEGMQGGDHDDHDNDHAKNHDHGHKKDHHHKKGDAHDDKDHAKKHDDHDDDDHGEAHADEHVWLSLKNARTLGAAIAEAVSSLDKNNAAEYKSNWETYAEKLSALDKEYQSVVESSTIKTLLFADRFPFRYMVDDYGLKYFAAFSGCSAETEASFETIVFLAKKIDQLKLRNIMVTESADHSIAKTVINNSKTKNQQILVMNAMQSVTSGDIQSGITYLSIMKNNLNVLSEALK